MYGAGKVLSRVGVAPWSYGFVLFRFVMVSFRIATWISGVVPRGIVPVLWSAVLNRVGEAA